MRPQLVLSSLTIIVFFFVSTAFSQESKYLGQEKEITSSELVVKANNTEFNGNFIGQIFIDKKNTYFAIDNGQIESRYVKIRILEQSFSDKKIVNISSSLNQEYILFLVNNKLIGKDGEILDLFNSYYDTAKKEETSMSEEDMTIWLNNHDKYNHK